MASCDTPNIPQPLACGDRRRLIELYAFQCRQYSDAVARLGRYHSEVDLFRRAFEEIESRRLACERTHTELSEHIAKHGCLK